MWELAGTHPQAPDWYEQEYRRLCPQHAKELAPEIVSICGKEYGALDDRRAELTEARCIVVLHDFFHDERDIDLHNPNRAPNPNYALHALLVSTLGDIKDLRRHEKVAARRRAEAARAADAAAGGAGAAADAYEHLLSLLPETPPELMLSPEELCEMLGKDRSTISLWRKNRGFPKPVGKKTAMPRVAKWCRDNNEDYDPRRILRIASWIDDKQTQQELTVVSAAGAVLAALCFALWLRQ